jgi:Protein of unknown function (DUF3102)
MGIRPPAELTQDITTSNSLADLAARIRAEHEAVGTAMKRGLKHAIAAGELLIEAKAQLAHGQWLPYLREHCHVPERTAQRYMLLARHASELESKSDNLADLTMGGAIELLTPPSTPDFDDWDSISEWAERLLDGPFTPFDFGNDDKRAIHDRYGWLETKLMHQAKVPPLAAWCFDVSYATKDGRPALRLCPWDDLLAAYEGLADVATGKRAFKFDFPHMAAMRGAIALVETLTCWMLGNVLNEIEHRTKKKISAERYEREWEETHSAVMARLDEQLAEIEHKRGHADAEVPS